MFRRCFVGSTLTSTVKSALLPAESVAVPLSWSLLASTFMPRTADVATIAMSASGTDVYVFSAWLMKM